MSAALRSDIGEVRRARRLDQPRHRARLEEGESTRGRTRADDLAVVARAFEGGPAAVELIGTPHDVPDRPLVALRSRARRDSVSDPTDAFIAWFSAVSGVLPFCTGRWPASSAWACSIPTAKDSPCAADGRMLIVVMPITSPLRVMSGPPLLPGLIARVGLHQRERLDVSHRADDAAGDRVSAARAARRARSLPDRRGACAADPMRSVG